LFRNLHEIIRIEAAVYKFPWRSLLNRPSGHLKGDAEPNRASQNIFVILSQKVEGRKILPINFKEILFFGKIKNFSVTKSVNHNVLQGARGHHVED
jgi:hypothetical protein